MKASIQINGKEVFSSNKISKLDLDKKVNKFEFDYGIKKMADRVKSNFKVFTSK